MTRTDRDLTLTRKQSTVSRALVTTCVLYLGLCAVHRDHISEHGLPTNTPLRLIELGAGAGLPSVPIARSYPNVRVLASNFPDPLLIHTLRENVGCQCELLRRPVRLGLRPICAAARRRHCPRGGRAVELEARRSAPHDVRGACTHAGCARTLRCGNAHGTVHARIALSGSRGGGLKAGGSD